MKKIKDYCTVNGNRSTNKILNNLIKSMDIRLFIWSEITKETITWQFKDSKLTDTCIHTIKYFIKLDMFDWIITNNTPLFTKPHKLWKLKN